MQLCRFRTDAGLEKVVEKLVDLQLLAPLAEIGVIPDALLLLIASGRWPGNDEEARLQI